MSSDSNHIQIQILSRFANLPIVNSAINLATDGYSRLKGYNGLVRATLSKAEQSILFVATTAMPVIDKFGKPSKSSTLNPLLISTNLLIKLIVNHSFYR